MEVSNGTYDSISVSMSLQASEAPKLKLSCTRDEDIHKMFIGLLLKFMILQNSGLAILSSGKT